MTTPAAIKALVSGDLENLIAASTKGGIEAQEARGQETFVQSETLPKECPRKDLESLGFVFGEDFDDIFINVVFPEGWKKVATEHSMHNDLIDDKGRCRGGIFYKAAFYDRHADLNLSSRYSVCQNFELETGLQFRALDGGEVIFSTELGVTEKHSDAYWTERKVLQAKAEGFLTANYPNYRDVLAYWD